MNNLVNKYLVLISILIVMFLYNSIYAQNNNILTEVITEIDQLQSLPEHFLDEVWTGFRTTRMPIGVKHNENVWIIDHPALGSEFKKIIDGVGDHNVFFFVDSLKKYDGYFDEETTELNGYRTIFINLHNKLTPSNLIFEITRLYFKVFVSSIEELKDRKGDSFIVPFFPINNSNYYAQAHIEQKLLIGAINAVEDMNQRKFVQEYFNINFRRKLLEDKMYYKYEEEEEIYSGLSAYAGYKVIEYLFDLNIAQKTIVDGLTKLPLKPEDFVKRSMYVGASLAILIDKYNSEWKDYFGGKIDLNDILALSIPPTDEIDNKVLLERFDYLNMRYKISRKLFIERRDRKKIRDSILNGNKIIIQFKPDERITVEYEKYGYFVVDDSTIIHENSLKLITDDGSDINVISGVSLTQIGNNNVFRINKFIYNLSSDTNFILNGKNMTITDIDSKIVVGGNSLLSINTENFKLKMKNIVLSKIDKNIVIIKN